MTQCSIAQETASETDQKSVSTQTDVKQYVESVGTQTEFEWIESDGETQKLMEDIIENKE